MPTLTYGFAAVQSGVSSQEVQTQRQALTIYSPSDAYTRTLFTQ